MMDGAMQFGVLGPLTVTQHGIQMDLGPAKPRAVLAVLLLSCNRPVHRDEIIRAVWGPDAPATARNVVHRYVADLRRRLEPERAPRSRGGRISSLDTRYQLRATDDEVDLLGFRRLVRSGRDAARRGDPQAALREFAAALDLWRGPCLSDVDIRAADLPTVAALDEEWLRTVIDMASAAQRLGRSEAALPYLARAAEREPLHEVVHAGLMVALAAAGRQAEALQRYQAIRRRLVDGLGIEPGEVLRAAHRRVLQHRLEPAGGNPPAGRTPATSVAAAPAAPAASHAPSHRPAQLPAAAAGFTGRAAELDQLTAIADAGTEAPATSVVVIAGGPGVGKTALAVHWGHRATWRFPDGQLYLDLRGHAPGKPVSPTDALAGALRAVGSPDRLPVDEPELAARYRSALAGRRMLIVLDDAADPEQVRPLLPGSPQCLVVVTSRRRLTGLVAREGARRIDLDTLSPAESRSLLVTLLGQQRVAAEPADAVRLAQLCCHLPLALRIAAAQLANQPWRSIAGFADQLAGGDRLSTLRLAEDEQTALRVAFDLSYRDLDHAARLLFRYLGLFPGGDFAHQAAAALVGIPPPQAAEQLDRLAAAHLVEQRSEDRYTFHDLLREYAVECAAELAPRERTAARQRLTNWYLRSAARAAELLYPQLTRLPPPEPAAGVTPLDFEDNDQAYSWLDSERPSLVALSHADDAGPTWRLADTLRGYFVMRRHTVDWLAVAAAATSRAGEQEEPSVRAAVRFSLADAHKHVGHYQQAIEHYFAALDLARAAGWRDGEGAILGNLGRAYSERGELRLAERCLRETIAIHRETGSLTRVAISMVNLGNVQYWLGEVDQAEASYAAALVGYQGAGVRRGYALHGLGNTSVHLGRFDEAETQFGDALQIFREIGDRFGEGMALDGLARLRCETGRHREALPLAQRALLVSRVIGDEHLRGGVLSTIGGIRLQLDHRRLARAHFQQATRLTRSIGARYQETVAGLGLAAVEFVVGRLDQAWCRAAKIRQTANQAEYRLLEGDAVTLLAEIELGRGQPGRAAELSQEAVEIHRRSGYRPGLAWALAALGTALQKSGANGDSTAAWRRAAEQIAGLGTPDADELSSMLGGCRTGNSV